MPTQRPRSPGEPCPDHGIIVHGSGTYAYADYRRNLIIDHGYFHRHIRYHDFKVEAHRFGSERSEDAVTWNVFRSLQKAHHLRGVARLCAGIVADEPDLYLWGLRLKDEQVSPWRLLVRCRERFESDLPAERPKTEPDIALHLPGKYLILIEAKFCSPNGVYKRDRVTKLLDLTIDQLVNIYQDRELCTLNYTEAARRDVIHYQLWRNMIFAEWMARHDGPTTQWYHVNLVRDGAESEVCEPMLTLMHREQRHRFEQITWEQLYHIAFDAGLNDLCRYMINKTAQFKPAFKLAASGSERGAGQARLP